MIPTIIPPIGSSEFKKLSFYDQLEIKSLELFNSEEYSSRVAGSAHDINEFTDLTLDIPQQEVDIVDLPVSFLHKHWALYNTKFKESWYTTRPGSGGLTPLDDYDLEVGYMVNARTFNFSLLSLYPSVNSVLSWVSKNRYKGDINANTLLDACKMYIFMLEFEGDKYPRASKLYSMASGKFACRYSLESLNGYLPVVEECEEVDLIEFKEFVVLPIMRSKFGRSCYPAIPSSLFCTGKFAISDWDFMSPR